MVLSAQYELCTSKRCIAFSEALTGVMEYWEGEMGWWCEGAVVPEAQFTVYSAGIVLVYKFHKPNHYRAYSLIFLVFFVCACNCSNANTMHTCTEAITK